MKDTITDWVGIIDDPTVGFFVGYLLGFSTKQASELVDIMLIWFRNKMIKDRRKKGETSKTDA